jgi:N-acetylglucosaminyldiphosphoundecaprenol N-acetyl-beta-D-mannosaminyltransferase
LTQKGNEKQFQWPRRYNLLGVSVSATTYKESVDLVIRAAQLHIPAVVTHLPVHGVVMASGDISLQSKIQDFQIVAPDGQPVRWALNYLYSTNLRDRVYGPELMQRLCHRASEVGIGIYLYGSTPKVAKALRDNLLRRWPSLQIKGYEAPPFRTLTIEEDKDVIERINSSGAGLVFLGLGCPLQDIFASEHQKTIKGVQVCVGAAFDFHSGNKSMAPSWMQRNSLEWLFRLVQEPRRLWRRYLFTNTSFLIKFIKQIISQKL